MSKPVIFETLFATDLNAEENGKWFEDILGDGSAIDVKLRRMTSKESDKTRNRLLLENTDKLIKGKFSEEDDKRIMDELLAEAILVDFRNVNSAAGVVENTYENRLMLIGYPDFRRIVNTLSQSQASFRKGAQDATEKN